MAEGDWNYSNFPGLGGKKDLPIPKDFKDGVPPPTDTKGYTEYRGQMEGMLREMTENQGFVGISARCETHKNGPGNDHFGCPFIAACDHVIVQDQINPEGVVFVPFYRAQDADGYVLCKTCFKLLGNRKFDFGINCKCKCSKCVGESIERILMLKPDRVVDLRKG